MPSQTTTCIHGIDSRFCASCQRIVKQLVPPLVPRKTTRARKVSSSQWLQHSFEGNERQLVLIPKVREGWRFHKKTACFSERIVIDSMHDRRVSVQVQLFPRPGIADSDWLPRLSNAKGPSVPNPLRYRVADGQLEISIDLIGDDDGFNPRLHWEPNSSSAKPQVHWQEFLTARWLRSDDCSDLTIVPPADLIVGPLSGIELQLLLTAEPRPLDSSISREWSRRFFPGGLPSLGKRP